MNLRWDVSAVPVANEANLIFEKFDLKSYNELCNKFLELPKEEKAKFKGLEHYIEKTNGLKLSDKQRNYKKYREEITENFNKGTFYKILPVDLYSEKDTIIDLLSSLETENYIKEAYKEKKKKKK